MKDFKKLIVWQKSMNLFVSYHKFCRLLPPEEKYGLSSQLRRAAFSIPANIAEGGAKTTSVHYKHFLEISLGSSYEVETALIAIEEIYSLLIDECNPLIENCREIQKMLISLINKISQAA